MPVSSQINLGHCILGTMCSIGHEVHWGPKNTPEENETCLIFKTSSGCGEERERETFCILPLYTNLAAPSSGCQQKFLGRQGE